MCHNTNRKHNIHHIIQKSKAKTLSSASTSNRFNNNLSSGDTTHLLTINISEKQSDYRMEHGSSYSANHSHSASKKKEKKTKLDNPPRKPSVMPSESVKGQKTIKAAIEAMNRKLSLKKNQTQYRTIRKCPAVRTVTHSSYGILLCWLNC